MEGARELLNLGGRKVEHGSELKFPWWYQFKHLKTTVRTTVRLRMAFSDKRSVDMKTDAATNSRPFMWLRVTQRNEEFHLPFKAIEGWH